MKTRIERIWSTLGDSLWFVPALFTATALGLAGTLMAADRHEWFWNGEAPGWLYQGEAEAARTVLNTITASLITVTGVLFSVTIVAVQLASSQYTPRVLRNFSSDRGNQAVMGIFIGTFTYGVMVLRTIRSSSAPGGEFVPRLSVTVAVALLVVCVASLIYFINHVAQEIRPEAILKRVTGETMRNVHQLFPEHLGHADPQPPPDPREPEHASVPVRSRKAGYVQMVDADTLFGLGRRQQMVIGMEPELGDFVLPGRPLAAVWTQGRMSEELEDAIRRAFVLGPERTPQQDVEFGMVQISDVAIKALSPSVNDPTTAVRCIDRLAEILAAFGAREPPESARMRDGTVRFIASYTTFDRAVKVAYDDIRHFGVGIPLIAQHLLDTLSEIMARVPDGRRDPLLEQARAVLHGARRDIEDPRDLDAVEQAAGRLAEKAGPGFSFDGAESESRDPSGDGDG